MSSLETKYVLTEKGIEIAKNNGSIPAHSDENDGEAAIFKALLSLEEVTIDKLRNELEAGPASVMAILGVLSNWRVEGYIKRIT